MYRLFRPRTAVAAVAILAATTIALADTVIPDDLIVQGSACIGLDCVDGESFGFDTIRLKENNTRIHFQDTSTSPGFPNHNWQLTANDSASGGLNKFSIEDLTAATVPFTILGSAPTNSVFVDSSGRVGLRTSTPVLDLQITTGNTPAQRLEQTTSGGFTAQTWDVAGNEANFFVRDVTSGSRLPFRIRPGAPTSSIDIAATGNVGMGTANPATKLHVVGATGSTLARFTDNANGTLDIRTPAFNVTDLFANSTAMTMTTQFGETMRLTGGNVGIGTTTPTAQLESTGSVRFGGVNSCGSGIKSDGTGLLSCISSSRQFKNITGDLPPQSALANIMALRPQTGSYKTSPDVPEHWLIAEEVAEIDPALVGLNDGKPYVVKTQNVVADLIAVVQQQQREIAELRRMIAAK
jgi:hypothetical protein